MLVSYEASDQSVITVEGRMAVEAMLDSGRFEVESLYVEVGRHVDLVEKAGVQDVPLQICDVAEIRAEAGFDFHRGIFARVQRPAGAEIGLEFLSRASRLVLPLGIADPGNLGTIVRSAAAFGADAVLVEKGRGTDLWGRKAIRASATAVFRLPVFEVTDPFELLEKSRSAGFVTVGTSLAEGAAPLSAHSGTSSERKILIVLGAEKDGLKPAMEEACDQLIRIPMENGMDSLNVAATAAIVCHHFFGGEAP